LFCDAVSTELQHRLRDYAELLHKHNVSVRNKNTNMQFQAHLRHCELLLEVVCILRCCNEHWAARVLEVSYELRRSWSLVFRDGVYAEHVSEIEGDLSREASAHVSPSMEGIGGSSTAFGGGGSAFDASWRWSYMNTVLSGYTRKSRALRRAKLVHAQVVVWWANTHHLLRTKRLPCVEAKVWRAIKQNLALSRDTSQISQK
jgi:hypothetical protein